MAARNRRKVRLMSSSSCPNDPRATLAADASVVINLNATGCAAEIIAAIPGTFAVTKSVLAELAEGARKGHDDAAKLEGLIRCRAVKLVELGDEGNGVYAELVDGPAEETLDDGEAATLAYAHEVRGVALIDEVKARRICDGRFPELRIASTVDVLIHEAVRKALGQERQIDAVGKALRDARMHVLPHQRQLVRELIAATVKSRRASGKEAG